jgi:hypothetical protein
MVGRIGLVAVFLTAMGLGTALAMAPADDPKEVVGTVKELNNKGEKFFVIKVKLTDESKDAMDQKFLVKRETKFTGPLGADREDGLQDPCMAIGYEVRVLPAKDDAKYAKEVKLSVRKMDEDKKKGKKGE